MFYLRKQFNYVLSRGKQFSVATVAASTHFNQIDRNTQIENSSTSCFQLPWDPHFLVSLLVKCRTIIQVKQVHTQVTINGMLSDLTVANKLLYVLVRHKALDDACALFDRMWERDPVTWSVMVGGFAKAGDFLTCFETFRELLRNGVQLDNYTTPSVIRACRDSKKLEMGGLVHCMILKHGLQSDQFVCAALVDMFAKCGVVGDAKKLFDKMPTRDVVTWTVMIDGYAECGNANESMVLFDRMREEGFVPDKVAMVAIVNACAKLGAMNRARLVYDFISRNHLSPDVILGTAMIDMFSKCGSLDCAREIFDKMEQKNVISWSAMIAAYGYHGQGRKALDLFPIMLSNGIKPNNITFVSLLHACSHAGLVEDGLRIFSMMLDSYGVKPDIKHYTCMIDMLGRSGRLNEALRLIENPLVAKNDEALWCAFLGACRIHKRADLAEKAAETLVELRPQEPGSYVLLSNIYANAGRWKDVAKVRDLMTKRKLKKVPGFTWIEVNNVIYQFRVGDDNHPQAEKIHAKLKSLSEKMELAGYIPDTDFVLHDVDEEAKVSLLYTHSEKLAIAFGLIATPEGTPIRITKNLRVCGDCHTFSKLVSAITCREIIVRDANRFHYFKNGSCSCGDYW